jgi:hypothetical protein
VPTRGAAGARQPAGPRIERFKIGRAEQRRGVRVTAVQPILDPLDHLPAVSPPARDVRVNLDAPVPVLRYFVRAQEVASPLVLTMVKGESELVDLRVTAVKGLYHWVAELQFVIAGKRSTVRIDDAGRPFHTTGLGAGPRYRFDGRTWQPETTS